MSRVERVAQIPAPARRVLIAANPKAGARSGRPLVEQLTELLRQRGMEAAVLTDRHEIAAQAALGQNQGWLRAVVCAGGDGTVGFVANVVPRGVPLVVLPLGTENLMAKYLGIPRDPAIVAELVEQGWTVRLDAGLAGGRLFSLMAGMGFDAEVVRRVHENRTGHIHHLSYAKPILDAIRTYTYPELRVYCEGGEAESIKQPIKARWVFVANLPCYAGGLRVVPDADATDGLLDVCTFKKGFFWKGLQYFAYVLLNRLRRNPEVRMLRARTIRIESDKPVDYQLDGDYGGQLPLQIEALPQRLTMVVPRERLEQLGLMHSQAAAAGDVAAGDA